MEKHYKILGLETTATLEEVKEKFNILYKEYNPEKQTDELKEFFKEEHEKVQEAYKTICLNIIQQNREDEKEEEIKEKEIKEKEKEEIKEEEKEEFDWEEDKDNLVEDKIEEGKIDNKESSFFQKILSENLNNAAYWARIIGVIMIILGIIQIIELYEAYEIFEDNFENRDYERLRDSLEPSFVLTFIYYGLCTLFFFMVGHAANKFATKIRSSLATQNHNILIEGLQMLSLYFKRIVIFFIIIGVYSSFLIGTYSYKDKNITKQIAAEQIIYSTPFTNLIQDYIQEKLEKERKEEERKRHTAALRAKDL